MKIPQKLKKHIELRKKELTLDLASIDKKIRSAQLLMEDLRTDKERTISELNDLIQFTKEVENEI